MSCYICAKRPDWQAAYGFNVCDWCSKRFKITLKYESQTPPASQLHDAFTDRVTEEYQVPQFEIESPF